jgi:SAM-dependent methyltransferase
MYALTVAISLGMVSLALILGALGFQYVGGIPPCEMCHWQRWPHIAAAILGLGGGSFPKRLYRDFPQVVVDVVDIDPEVIAIAKRYFQVPEDSRLRLHRRDGRRFLQETADTYDLIFLDAYNSDTIPFHLTTREFYREIEAHLAPDGVVVSNIIGALHGPQSAFFRAMYRTLAAAFPTVYVVPTYDGRGTFVLGEINILLFATRDQTRLTRAELMAQVGRVGGKVVAASDLMEYASYLLELPVPVSDVPLLTDDYAPVEIYMAGWFETLKMAHSD